MDIKIGQWMEIFRAGDYGLKGKYTNLDLDRIVSNFNSHGQVPIVIGHPENDSPEVGWLSGIKRVGNVLLGKAGELNDSFMIALAENRYRNRSIRITQTVDGPKLHHLSFLGAMLPQVEGLSQNATFFEVCDFFEKSGYDLTYNNFIEGNQVTIVDLAHKV